MIRCVVFDFDGTLVDSNQIKTDSFYKAIESLGDYKEIVDQIIKSEYKGDRYSIIQSIVTKIEQKGQLPHNFSKNEWEKMLEKSYSTICEEMIFCCPEIPGACETLKILKEKNIFLIINSSTPECYLKRIVELRNLDHFFNHILGEYGKKIENLTFIKNKYQFTPKEMLFVGDGEDDLAAATKFGCHFVGVINKEGKLINKSQSTISNLIELTKIIENYSKD